MPKFPNSEISKSVLDLFFILPPAVADKTHDGKGCGGKIDDGGIERLGRAFAQLGSCFGTDGTLRHHQLAAEYSAEHQKNI